MKKELWKIVPVLAVLFTLAGTAQAQVRAGLSFTDQGLDRFYLSIGDFYRVPREQVVVVRERHLPDEEVPVVFFIAREARVSPEEVVVLRQRGQSWREIAIHFRLGPGVFYAANVHASGPYARPYGYYHGRTDWKQVRFTDADVVNCVNLRFLSEHYRCAPDRIVGWRSQGRAFRDMDRDLGNQRYPDRGRQPDARVARDNGHRQPQPDVRGGMDRPSPNPQGGRDNRGKYNTDDRGGNDRQAPNTRGNQRGH
jgi:hypothetical protein